MYMCIFVLLNSTGVTPDLGRRNLKKTIHQGAKYFLTKKGNWMRQLQSSSIAPDLLTRVWQRRAIDGISFALAG